MKSKISAIIIDKNKNEHDYTKVISYNLPEWVERNYDITVYDNVENILSKLNLNRGYDCLITIGDVDNINELNQLPFEVRRKWCHLTEFDEKRISDLIVGTFLLNNGRENCPKKFSIFTCTFNTPKSVIIRLYESLKRQTYNNWNWWILDDSKSPTTAEYIEKLHDPRITIFRNVTNHGNIGFNKHSIAMLCDGDYLVEVDHDDELTSDCLEKLLECYEQSDADFVYSDCLEIIDNAPIYYGNNFSFGQGYYRDEVVEGTEYKNVAITCRNINAKSIRGIYACPNHVRTWKREFYHSIGGHNTELSVLDDLDIVIRTFLKGKIAKVDKVLYIQNQGESKSNGRGDTATGSRLNEIARTNILLKWKYEVPIHERIVELIGEDPIWDENTKESNVDIEINPDELKPMDCLITK